MSKSCLLLFDFRDEGNQESLLFRDPLEIICAQQLHEVRPALRKVQRACAAGFYAAGYLSYEAAAAFDPALPGRSATRLPLLWFGIFQAPARSLPPSGSFTAGPWQPGIDRASYARHIAAIKRAIAEGITYQTNYTLRLRADVAGDDLQLYQRLRGGRDAAYCAYLNLGRYRILSASPELFFRWDGQHILARPMKGTAKRGRWTEEDEEQAAQLAASAKERAENLMIVDLLRNDLGRIAVPGSVQVPALFEVERYRTVWQMTSTVSARTRPGVTLEDIFAALFPCGSVTGAPKVSTMRLIAALEPDSREVYCGAIGLVAPGGAATFNVAIRTLWIDAQSGQAEYGIGGGVTWDSTTDGEYEEALTKAAVLNEEWPNFALLETLRLEHGRYVLLERHLQRLTSSARYFGVPLAAGQARAALERHARRYPQQIRRVRLLVTQAGEPQVESTTLEHAQHLSGTPLPIALADAPVSRNDRFLYHKTTQRSIYDSRRAGHPDVFDVLLFNEQDELTEFTTGNLVVELAGQLWTPPRASGLLDGTLRAELLACGAIRERALTRDDLCRASRLWYINSVRGWVPVRWVAHDEGGQQNRAF